MEDNESTAAEQATAEDPESFEAYQARRIKGEAAEPAKEEASNSEGSEESESAGDPDTPGEKQGEEENKEEKKGRKLDAERRISQLTRQRKEAEARAKELEEELRTARSGKSGQPEGKAEAKSEGKAPVRPQQKDFEDYDAYETALEKYREELIDWKVEQRLAKQAAQAEKDVAQAKAAEETQTLAKQWNEKSSAAREKHSDFDEVLDAHKQQLPQHLIQTLFESEQGPEMAYYLAKNPDELEKIAGMSPIAAVKALGRLEDKLSPPATEKAKTSKAPPPPKPVGGGKSVPTLESITDYEQYAARRREQIKQAA